MNIALLVVVVVLAAVCAVLVAARLADRKKIAILEQSLEEEKTNLQAANAKLESKNEEYSSLMLEKVRMESEMRGLNEKLQNERSELNKLQETFKLEFRNLANDILEEKSRQFKRANKESLDVLLKPFKDNLSDFKKRVEDIYSEENRQHGALKNELNNLMELNRKITQETTNLTNALKGNSKVQGDWGEMILERMLESSNLKRGIHYFVQENFKDEDGNNLRPDIVLTLPEGKRIVIDSKVSLTAYVAACSAETDSDREAFMKEHVGSIRRHINELFAKNYQTLVDSPDFVIMFVPNEPAFTDALNLDTTLWAEAYNKKVIISSPTNLFALLKIVDDLWKRDNQSRNAIAIAEEGGRLYDKLVGFVSSLEEVGRNIDRAQKSYEQAYGQLKAGRGNLISRSEKLRELGVKASKKLSSQLVDDASEQNEGFLSSENE